MHMTKSTQAERGHISGISKPRKSKRSNFGPLAMLGYARKLRKGKQPKTTSEWMREIREACAGTPSSAAETPIKE
ncbi:hypothetical protein [Ereboglobus luteus]|uniref:hypothetical protein n=1 Tax=Ereboglobus luteus TaxID=1796921 RepID=UPI001F327AFF|nr:hypothetical protein [Ereboglobus luteus]